MTQTINLDNSPVLIREVSWKSARLALISSAVVVLIIFMELYPTGEPSPVWLWFAAVFFGLGIPLGVMKMIWPGSLRVGPSGIDITLFALGSMTTNHVDWSDVDYFDLISVGRGATIAGWHYSPHYVPKTKTGRVLLGVSGRTGGLAGSWSLSKNELVALLKQAQARWGGPASGSGAGAGNS